MDWRFVDDGNWGLVHSNLNGAGVESMSAKWDEMFGVKEEVVVEEVKVKKPRKKAVTEKVAKKMEKRTVKKKATGLKKERSGNKKPAKNPTVLRKGTGKKSKPGLRKTKPAS